MRGQQRQRSATMAGKDTSTLCLFDVDGTLTVGWKTFVPAHSYRCSALVSVSLNVRQPCPCPRLHCAQVARKVITQEMKDVIKALRDKVTVRPQPPSLPSPLASRAHRNSNTSTVRECCTGYRSRSRVQHVWCAALHSCAMSDAFPKSFSFFAHSLHPTQPHPCRSG
jgi:hypothetical protein